METSDIEEFSSKYRNSSEEEEDLVDFYTKKEGDLTLLLEFIPCSENSDIPRFMKTFQDLISQGKLTETPQFLASKIRPLDDESKEIEEDSMNNLSQLIRAKNENRQFDFIKNLEAKYAPKKKSKPAKSQKKPKLS